MITRAEQTALGRNNSRLDGASADQRCSLIVVTYNSGSTIRACLTPLLDMQEIECIVVDNHSSDDTAALLTQEFPSVQLIALSENVGFARACNIGVAASNGSVILLLNPDAVASQAAVRTLVTFLEQHPQAGTAGARLIDPSGRPLQSMGNRPSVLGCLLDKPLALLAGVTGGQGALRRLLGALSAKYRLPECPERVAWVSGAALCCRRTAWQQVDGFDGAFFLYYEDVDLCLRLTQSGWEVWHVPEAVILHQSGSSFASDRERQKRAYYTSQRYLFHKHNRVLVARMLDVTQGLYRRLNLYRQFAADRIGRPFSATPGKHN